MGPREEDGDDGRLIGAVGPPVAGAVLHDGVARLEHLLGAVVELEHDFTRQHDVEVDGVGGMHARLVGVHVVHQPGTCSAKSATAAFTSTSSSGPE